eukprot:scaffold120297_cov28-Tisochrysis_lutea.AAC.1
MYRGASYRIGLKIGLMYAKLRTASNASRSGQSSILARAIVSGVVDPSALLDRMVGCSTNGSFRTIGKKRDLPAPVVCTSSMRPSPP